MQTPNSNNWDRANSKRGQSHSRTAPCTSPSFPRLHSPADEFRFNDRVEEWNRLLFARVLFGGSGCLFRLIGARGLSLFLRGLFLICFGGLVAHVIAFGICVD